MQTSDQPLSANTVLRFSSSREQGLGDALPAGTVRVYQRDVRGNPQFVGEHAIGHTPMGSDISLATGQAFDIKVRPIVDTRDRITYEQWRQSERFHIWKSDGSYVVGQVERPASWTYWHTKMRYLVTNASPKPVTVDLRQSGLSWDTRVVQETLPSEKLSADEVRWRVPVPASSQTVVTADFYTPY
jgi:hypothetical protein